MLQLLYGPRSCEVLYAFELEGDKDAEYFLYCIGELYGFASVNLNPVFYLHRGGLMEKALRYFHIFEDRFFSYLKYGCYSITILYLNILSTLLSMSARTRCSLAAIGWLRFQSPTIRWSRLAVCRVSLSCIFKELL